MTTHMTCFEYVSALKGQENLPASLKILLDPFKIDGLPVSDDEFLLVGHLLDAISAEQRRDELINAETVLELALELGLVI